MTPHKRIYALDLLRAIAVIAVVLYHFPREESALAMVFRALTHFGLWGVDLFFILSGYLIGRQWFRDLAAQRSSLKKFFFRRFVRTLPCYYVFLVLAVAFNAFMGWPQPDIRYLFFLQNFGGMDVITHTWSLCIEEHFYLIFPFAAYLFWRSSNRATVFYGFVFLIPIILRAAAWYSLRPDLTAAQDIHGTYRDFHNIIFFPTYMRLDTVALGTAIAYVQTFWPTQWEAWMKRSGRFLGLGLAFLILAMPFHRFSFIGSVLSFSFVGLGFAAMLIGALGEGSLLDRRHIPGVSLLARCSYSLYLTHPLALGVAHYLCKIGGWNIASPIGIALLFVCIAVACALLYLGVEKPVLNWRDRRFSKRTAH